MTGHKSTKPYKHEINSSFKPSPLIVNYSHSVAYSKKSAPKTYGKKEKLLYYLKKIGYQAAAFLVSIGTLWFVWKQTNISKEAMRISNRPYIGIDSIPIPYFSQSDVKMTIKNAGNTPAYNTNIVFRIELLPVNIGHKVPQFRLEDEFPGQYFIPAGITKEITREWESLKAFELNDIENRTIRFFVHGLIKYDDIFGEKHFTKFGFQFTPNVNIEFCNDHNDADQIK